MATNQWAPSPQLRDSAKLVGKRMPRSPLTPATPTKQRRFMKEYGRSSNHHLKQGQAVFVQDVLLGWTPGVIVEADENRIKVALHDDLEEERKITRVNANLVELRSEDYDYQHLTKLTSISPLSTAAVLHCLRVRFLSDQIYTAAGHALVSVNPFRDLPQLYHEDQITKYQTAKNLGDLAPHVYGVGAKAYRQIELGLANQSIIVSGESGAGKTVSAKYLMKYLVTVSNGTDQTVANRSARKGEAVEIQVLQSNPILEAFGNASTIRNHNSSRFGKYIQLHFSSSGEIQGSSIQTYLLEKTRVVHQGASECNFHIFYQLLTGLEPTRKEELGLNSANLFKIARNGGSFHSLSDARQRWIDVKNAMLTLGLAENQIKEIEQVLCSILHLGNVEFKEDSEDEDIVELDTSCDDSELGGFYASSLLGLELDDFKSSLTHRRITASHRRRQSVYSKPCTVQEASNRLHCVAKLVYSRLFDWLVEKINQSLECSNKHRYIGLLDIYGFESFKENSLEQLCINYANEALQQHYVRHFLRDLQDDYEEEGINWDMISFHDNRPCLDAIEGHPGVFALINEECQLNRPCSDGNLKDRLVSELSTSSYICDSRHAADQPQFFIRHYAHDVSYLTRGLIEKNKDHVPLELVQLLQDSDNAFIGTLFSDYEVEGSRKKKTVLSKFKTSVEELMESLEATNAHYIRCIKPSSIINSGSNHQEAGPVEFDGCFVLSQLEASGLVETVEMAKKAYPTRMPYEEFNSRFRVIIRGDLNPKPSKFPSPVAEEDENKENAYDVVDNLYHKQLKITPKRHSLHVTPKKRLRRRTGLSSGDHIRKISVAILEYAFRENALSFSQFGLHKLFLKDGKLEELEGIRLKLLSQRALVIQCAWRRHLVRQKLKKRKAAKCIQSAFRCWRQRKLYLAQLQEHESNLHLQLELSDEVNSDLCTPSVYRRSEASPFCSDSSPLDIFATPMSCLPGVRDISPLPVQSGYTMAKHQIDEVDDDSFVICTERTLDGTTYHIIPSPSPASRTVLEHDETCQDGTTPFKTPLVRHTSPHTNRLDRTDMGECSQDLETTLQAATPKIQQKSCKVAEPRKLFTNSPKTPALLNIQMSPVIKSSGKAFKTVAAAISAAVLNQRRFHMSGAFQGIPYFEAQNGVVSRRRMPRVQIKFHTKPNPFLKYGHYVSSQELQCSLTDCLQTFD